MVYRQTLEIKNIWFKVIATLILSIIFMSFSFLNIFSSFSYSSECSLVLGSFNLLFDILHRLSYSVSFRKMVLSK